MVAEWDSVSHEVVCEDGPFRAGMGEVKVGLCMYKIYGLVAGLEVEEAFASFGKGPLEGCEAYHGGR